MAIPLYLLLLLPLAFAATLTWQAYVRLTLITAGLGYLGWRHRGRWGFEGAEGGERTVAVLVAAALMFAITQFDPATGADGGSAPVRPLNGFFIASSFLVLIAFGAFLFSGKSWGRLMPLDWTVIGTILLFLGLSIGTRLLLKQELSWAGSVRLVLYGMLWFLITRWLPSAPDAGRRLLMGMPCVFAVICLVGGTQAGTAFYHYRAGLKAQSQRASEEALKQYDRAAEMGQRLRLDALVDASLFQKAEVLYRQGNVAEAARTLSMEEGFVRTIPAEAWEGPGGDCFTRTSVAGRT